MSHDRVNCLSHCLVTNAVELKNTTNGLHLLTLACGRKAIFRAKSLETKYEHSDVEPGTYYQKEVVASLMSSIFEFHFVPTTVIRTIRGNEGSLQEFVEKGRAESFTPYKQAELAAFDFVTGNTHRHKDNYLFDKNQEVWLTGASLSFHHNDIEWGTDSLFLEQAISRRMVIPDTLKKLYKEKVNKIADAIFFVGLDKPFETSFWVRKRIIQFLSVYTFDELPMTRIEANTAGQS